MDERTWEQKQQDTGQYRYAREVSQAEIEMQMAQVEDYLENGTPDDIDAQDAFYAGWVAYVYDSEQDAERVAATIEWHLGLECSRVGSAVMATAETFSYLATTVAPEPTLICNVERVA